MEVQKKVATEHDQAYILIVDDIPDNLFVLQKTLERHNYVTKVATSGEKAFMEIEKQLPDLIILDVLMPVMNGFEVCQKLKSMDTTKDIPVIFLTAKTAVDDIVEAFEKGGNDYILKPFNISEVLARVKTHLDLKKARDENKKYIEALKQTNDELTQAKQELKELNKSKDKFFSIVAHDLKNPFQGFLGMTQILMSEIDSFTKEEIGRSVTEMNDSANILFKLLENLLTWSRIQMGKIELNPMEVDLWSLTSQSLDVYGNNAKLKKISLVNEVQRDIRVLVDPLQLDTVLRNLISNAVKFTYEGGTVKLYSNLKVDRVELIISDNGAGISQDDQELLFKIDSGFSKNGTNDEIGTGLGLILCKELIEQNGGTISVKSQLDQGSDFIITLPLS